MNSSRSYKSWQCGALLPLCGLLLFAAPSSAKADASSHDAAQSVWQVTRIKKAFDAPLDLTVENLSAEEVAKRVEKACVTIKPAIRIEVRDVLPVKLSFGVKGSTVGKVLSSTAALAGARLWVFADHTLLAPEYALTTKEYNAISDGSGSELSATSAQNPTSNKLKQKALSALIVEDVNATIANGGQTTSVPLAVTNKGITVGQLSSDGQAILQELVNEINRNHPNSDFPPHKLSTDTLVSFNPQSSGWLTLNFPQPGNMMTWSVAGGGAAFGFSPSTTTQTPTTRPSLPLDLSAGKS